MTIMKLTKKHLFYFLISAFKDILRPRIISIVIMPFIGSFLVWGIITYFLWGWLTSLGVSLYNVGWIQSAVLWLKEYVVISEDPFVFLTTFGITLGVILPLALISALLITSIFLVPVIVDEIRKIDFPTLLKKSNSIFAGTGASLSLSAKYFFTWVGTLPLWVIIPGGNIIIPFLLLAWFNSRLFTWEVLIEIADKNEVKLFIKNQRWELFGLGLITAFLYFIPFVNFIAPVLTAASFSRYCLNRLYFQRQQFEKLP